MTNITKAVAAKLGVSDKQIMVWLVDNRRNHRIIQHYIAELERGHMGYLDAIDRVCGDIQGRNYCVGHDQHSEIRL